MCLGGLCVVGGLGDLVVLGGLGLSVVFCFFDFV